MKIKEHTVPMIFTLAIIIIIGSLNIYLTTNQKEEKTIAILTMVACIPKIVCVLRGNLN